MECSYIDPLDIARLRVYKEYGVDIYKMLLDKANEIREEIEKEEIGKWLKTKPDKLRVKQFRRSSSQCPHCIQIVNNGGSSLFRLPTGQYFTEHPGLPGQQTADDALKELGAVTSGISFREEHMLNCYPDDPKNKIVLDYLRGFLMPDDENEFLMPDDENK